MDVCTLRFLFSRGSVGKIEHHLSPAFWTRNGAACEFGGELKIHFASRAWIFSEGLHGNCASALYGLTGNVITDRQEDAQNKEMGASSALVSCCRTPLNFLQCGSRSR